MPAQKLERVLELYDDVITASAIERRFLEAKLGISSGKFNQMLKELKAQSSDEADEEQLGWRNALATAKGALIGAAVNHDCLGAI